jgi:phosphatidylserine/phosphatidylglycerophosphate/cardiolipin synthase-like enzyme
VTPLVDGAAYFARLRQELEATRAGDQVYVIDFRGDLEEHLDDSGTSIGDVLVAAARRDVLVFGLLWRSHPGFLQQSEEKNAEFARTISENGGEVLLDARTRRAGSHHQKLVVIRHPDDPASDVAFIGGIDLGLTRRDDTAHRGDPQVMDFPSAYGERPPWHDVQAEVRGPAVHDLEHTFRERWYGSCAVDIPSPLRQLYDRAYHASAMTGIPLPEPLPEDPTRRGRHAVQVLRTYPARMRRYPFAPLGERSIAHSYRKAFFRARRLVYLEDQYLWSDQVADLLIGALRRHPDLSVVVVVPRHSDREPRAARIPTMVGRERLMRRCRAAGGDRFLVFDVENEDGVPIYVHAKVAVVDDVWAVIGSDNLNRRSWSHDSELSVAVLDAEPDGRTPDDPASLGECARKFARGLRLRLMLEHLGRDPDQDGAEDELVDPGQAVTTLQASAEALDDWYAGGCAGPRPPGRLRAHRPPQLSRTERLWATPLYRMLYDPDGRAWRDRLRRRP